MHLGKVPHFRKSGIGIPPRAGKDNFDRLGRLIEYYTPERIVFLGDLFHSKINNDWFRFEVFLSCFEGVVFELVKGNHDVIDDRLFANAFDSVHAVASEIPPFILTHDPSPKQSLYNLCGHIHPAVRLKGKGHQWLRLPCFYFSDNFGILPAFGSFTGTYTLHPSEKDNVFIIAEGEVIKIN